MKLRQLLALAVGLATVSAAFAQPAAPPPSDEPIVVTGRRDGGRLLAVDFQRVARECAACKPMLAEIAKRSTPYKVKKGQIARDRESTGGAIGRQLQGHIDRPNPVKVPDGATFLDPYASFPSTTKKAGRQAGQMSDNLNKDQVELAAIRGDTSRLVAYFLAQLEPHVVKAAEEERLQRKASAVVKLERRATQARAVDVTNAIIRRIDAQQIAFSLPSAEGQQAAR